ncbi:MAG: gamma-glutamyl-gamma-aminobutyrate hydrolase family protein [Propionibacteriaceae bacterium]
MGKPIIGIVSGFFHNPAHMFPGYPQLSLNEDYTRSITAAGGVAIVIPIGEDVSVAGEVLELVDGLVFSGGQDIDPQLYGQVARPLCGEPSPLRDDFELALMGAALASDVPVFGICRGLQLLNVALGGTLHQDLSEAGATDQHSYPSLPAHLRHPVSFAEGSFLRRWTDAAEARVNSFHHQVAATLGTGLVSVASSPDGLVEAVERDGGHAFCGAVQWHPEMTSREDEISQLLFRGFVAECAKLTD